MLFFIRKMNRGSVVYVGLVTLTLVSLMLASLCGVTFAAGAKQNIDQKTFTSPEEAVKGLVVAIKAGDVNALFSDRIAKRSSPPVMTLPTKTDASVLRRCMRKRAN